MEPAPSWMLVRFVSDEPQWERLFSSFFCQGIFGLESYGRSAGLEGSGRCNSDRHSPPQRLHPLHSHSITSRLWPNFEICPNLLNKKQYFRVLFFFFFCLNRAAPKAYGGSQARGLIGAVAAGLHHSSQQYQILNQSHFYFIIL